MTGPETVFLRAGDLPEPDEAVLAELLISGPVPGRPDEDLLREIRFALRELGAPAVHPGRRCAACVLAVMAGDRQRPELDPESAFPQAAAALGISREQLCARLDSLIHTARRNCPEEVFAARFPEGAPDRDLFLRRVFERVYSRMGRDIWMF